MKVQVGDENEPKPEPPNGYQLLMFVLAAILVALIAYLLHEAGIFP